MKDLKGFTRTEPIPVECLRYEPRKVAREIIFGQRRSKSKLRDIEMSLQQLGKVIYQMSKEHYTFEKSFRQFP